MSDLLSFDDACERIFGLIEPLGFEYQDTRYAENFVLAEDAVARRSNPFADLSAMDGYAVRAEDVAPGKPLTVIGRIAAGGSAGGLEIAPTLAARIFTGAPIPKGADAVLIQENTEPGEHAAQIIATDGVAPGKFVRPMGMDFREGDVLIPAGKRLGPADLGLLLSGGISRVMVRRHPSIEIISTGDELVEAEDWTPELIGKIPSSNGTMVRAILGRQGFGAFVQPTVPDQLGKLEERFEGLKHDTDLVISTGGASVGEHDIIRQFLEAKADEIHVHKIAVRPGKPVMLARLGSVWWLALPGNPVSSFVTTYVFGLGIALRLSGDTRPWPQYQSAQLGTIVPANDQRLEFMRAVLDDGTLTPFDRQDSSMLKTLAAANALMVRPAHAPEMQPGDWVKYVQLS